jgi:hypothetical protein
MGWIPERVGLTWPVTLPSLVIEFESRPSGFNHVNSTMTDSNVPGFLFFLRHAFVFFSNRKLSLIKAHFGYKFQLLLLTPLEVVAFAQSC